MSRALAATLFAALLGASCAVAQPPERIIPAQEEAVATAACTEAPTGLVGRWYTTDVDRAVWGDARLTEATFRADGTGELRAASRAGTPYVLAAPLVQEGDALVGTFRAALGAHRLDFDVRLEEPRLVMTVRGEGSVLDLERAAGELGGLAGTWALRSLSNAPGDDPTGLGRIVSLTFTADSLGAEVASRFHYCADSASLYLGADPDDARTGDPVPFLLDGDRLALKLTDGPGFALFARAPDAAPR